MHLAPIIRRTLTVAVDPRGHSAWVKAPALDGLGPIAVAVEPAETGSGWHVADPAGPEPTWWAEFPDAIEEAVALAAFILAEQIGRELPTPPVSALPRDALRPADIR